MRDEGFVNVSVWIDGSKRASNFNRTRLAQDGAVFKAGHISLADDSPGLGIEPDEALLSEPVATFT